MLVFLGTLLIVLWIVGLLAHFAGGFIHLVLAIAIVMFALHFLEGKPAKPPEG